MELRESDLETFETVYTDLIKQFPPEELKTHDRFIELLNSPCYKLFGLYENNRLCGYTIVFIGEKYILADYIAVIQTEQSKGLGSRIIQMLPQIFKNKDGCFFEVEKITPENPQTQRRAKFYTSNGAVKLNINYIYPNNNGGLPMDLYYLSFGSSSPKHNHIRQFIKELFSSLHTDVNNLNNIISGIY